MLQNNNKYKDGWYLLKKLPKFFDQHLSDSVVKRRYDTYKSKIGSKVFIVFDTTGVAEFDAKINDIDDIYGNQLYFCENNTVNCPETMGDWLSVWPPFCYKEALSEIKI